MKSATSAEGPSARRRLAVSTLVGSLLVLCRAPSDARADMSLNLYGDIDYLAQRQGSTASDSFAAPRFEVFYTATQERLSFLAEAMMEVNDDNEFGVDLERIEVGYLFAEWLRLRAGRFHTAIGYYNDAYHHGRYFQTTVDRPESVRFEDEGGLLPAHSVGVHVDGRIALGRTGSMRYDIDLANGRGSHPGEVTNGIDRNRGKAVNMRLRYEPRWLEGLIVGASVYLDQIPAMATATATDPAPLVVNVGERLYGAHLVYFEHDLQLITELMRIEHRADLGNGTTLGVTDVGFAELGYVIQKVTPYLRFEKVVFPAALDPFLAQNPLAVRGSFSSLTAGVRYLVSEYVALKLEGAATVIAERDTIWSAATQCAFAF